MINISTSNKKIGMRNIKTTVAVAICLLLLYPFENITPTPACFAAIICMQDSVEKTISQGLSRFIGTLIGGVIAMIIVYIDMQINIRFILTILVIIGITTSIYCCNLVGHGPATVAACFALCIVLLSYEDNARYSYAILRILETLLGIVVAVFINKVLPDNRNKKRTAS